ncbi:hypothetical protein PVAP13_3KG174927 [Panicum virgatum]|uniref:Uncharacterized protein n=1 Tax=Panicum virgatum TaxID=38727 RepID=A0A8T0UXK4_PANVG|nr:hypothetical protein PVAP13_3KG174927 [Panicum virgatum]
MEAHRESDVFLEPSWIKLASFTLGLEYSPLIASLAASPLPKCVKCTPSQLITFAFGGHRSRQPGFPALKLYGGLRPAVAAAHQYTMNGHSIPEEQLKHKPTLTQCRELKRLF